MYSRDIALSDLPIGSVGIVKSVNCSGCERKMLQNLGIVQGTRIRAVQSNPSGNPVAYCIRGAIIALRKENTSSIVICRC